MPYVGSGLNRLVAGSLGSWEDLVKEVAKQSHKLGSEHQIKRSGLTMPQQLEIYLRTAATDTEARGKIFEAFKTAFTAQGQPSTFHKRLAKMFPVLLTTNYNDLLAASDPSKRRVIDLTAPNCNLDLAVPCICHLHGRWASEMARKELEPRIFAGVGLHDECARPCLVLTENQYHRVYSDPEFSGALTKILEPPNVLLFLGASLATDEAGMHHILTERRIAGGSFSGLYVGVDMDPLKERLLSLRGIQCINLPRAFGFSRSATEVLFHALFDQMERSFGVKPPSLASPTPAVPGPEILCTGLAAWNRILSLGSKKSIGTETSYLLRSEDVVEEPGGQHLAPALYLVSRGHRVALATTTGDDALGDQVKKWVTRHLERVTERKGKGDLIVWAWQIKGNTRLTTAVTYGGTRVIFDYDGDGLGDLQAPNIDWEQWDSLKALYLGSYYLDFEETLLAKLPNVKWRFFETGTRGPSNRPSFERAVNVAKQCTHVLSSSEFALRLAGLEEIDTNADTVDCQRRLYEDATKGKATIARAALKRLWPKPKDRANLVVVMGGFGALVVTRGRQVRYMPAGKVKEKRGRSWLGCGDIFRAEFIHQVLKGANCVSAAKAATDVVAKKIERMPFLPTHS